MKRLFDFQVSKIEEVEVPETSQNEQGETVTTIKKVKKEIPYKFFIRKPNRALSDEANLFYQIKVSEGIRAGLLTFAQLKKRALDDGSLLSSEQENKCLDLYKRMYELEKSIQSIEVIKPEIRTDEDKTKLDSLIKDLTDTRLQLNDYETIRSSVFESSAEFRARNYAIVWWLLNLSYQDVAGKEESFFGEGKYDIKINKYDEINESADEFLKKVVSKFLTYITLWATNRATTPEDFERLEKLFETPNVGAAPDTSSS